MSTRRRLLTNAAANWVSFAVTAVVTFFMSPLLVHGLGDRAYGVWALVDSVLAYLALFDLGIGAAVVRYVARFRAMHDRDELNRVFSTSVALFGGLGLAALATSLLLAFCWREPLGVPPDLAHPTRWLLVLLGLNLAAGLPFGVYDSVLCALEQFAPRTAIQLCVLVLRTLTFVLILRNGGGLLAIALAITLFAFLQHLLVACAAHALLTSLRFSRRFVTLGTFHIIRGYSLWAFVAMIAGRLSFSTDAIVISAFLEPQYITYFAIAARLVEYVKSGIRSATGILTPAISALEAQGELDRMRNIFVAGANYVAWCALPIQLSLICWGYPFLLLWMGRQIADDSYTVLLLLSLPLTLVCSQSITGRALYGIGRLRGLTLTVLIEAVANVVISIALVRRLGIVGVALGTLLPSIACNIVLMSLGCSQLKINVRAYLARVFAGPLLASAPFLLIYYAQRHLLNIPSTWGHLILSALGPLAAYGLTYCIATQTFRSTFPRMRNSTMSTFREHQEALAVE